MRCMLEFPSSTFISRFSILSASSKPVLINPQLVYHFPFALASLCPAKCQLTELNTSPTGWGETMLNLEVYSRCSTTLGSLWVTLIHELLHSVQHSLIRFGQAKRIRGSILGGLFEYIHILIRL